MTLPVVHPFLMSLLRGATVQSLPPSPSGDQAWGQTLSEASAQGIVPFLHRWLQRADLHDKPPASIAEQITAGAAQIAAHNLWLAHDLVTILRAFADKGVPCIPMRGLALAEQLYGNIAIRPMGDIDLLVRREDVPLVAKILGALGFRAFEHRPGFAEAFSYTLVFLKDRHGWVIVEPHWTIAYPPFADRVDMEGVWKRCRKGKTLGMETWRLSREDLLLHLCLHLSHYGPQAPLLWFYELDRLLRQDDGALDWDQFMRVARQSGQALMLAESLGKVTGLFASPVPDQVFSELTAPFARQPHRSTHGSVPGLIERSLAGASQAKAREELALFFTLKGVRTKWRYVAGLLFPSPEFMMIRYGLSSRAQLPLSYLHRIGYVSWEGFKGMVRLFRK